MLETTPLFSIAIIFRLKRERRLRSITLFPIALAGIFIFETLICSLSCTKSITLEVMRRLASLIAISRSGYTTSAPSFSRISPCSALLAFEITCGIPIDTRLRVVSIEVSSCSPIHTTATSQFCIPVD